MRIQWLGHASFRLTNDAGQSLVTDPYNAETGYTFPAVTADVVTVSHAHEDHTNTAAVQGAFTIVNTPVATETAGFTLRGISTYHDAEGGTERGENILFCIEADGLRICHCGDLGHMLSTEQMDTIGPIDVLMIPVGGLYTIDAVIAERVCEAIGARVVLPMHYKTERCTYPIAPVNGFLARMQRAGYEINTLTSEECELRAGDLPPRARVIVLDYLQGEA